MQRKDLHEIERQINMKFLHSLLKNRENEQYDQFMVFEYESRKQLEILERHLLLGQLRQLFRLYKSLSCEIIEPFLWLFTQQETIESPRTTLELVQTRAHEYPVTRILMSIYWEMSVFQIWKRSLHTPELKRTCMYWGN